jgi:carboxylate-amine ligase
VVRDGDGRLRVLEDNLRTPSGVAYGLSAREIVTESLSELGLPGKKGEAPCEIRQTLSRLLAGVLRPRPPNAGEDDATVLLSDGPGNSAWFEHRLLADLLDIPLVRTGDLRRCGERLQLREDGRGVAVVYRRTDQERARLLDGALTEVGDLLLAPVLNGTLHVVNGFGTGVADDKLVYPFVPAMIGFYLGEEPLIDSVPTFDLGEPAQRAQALERLDELVIKPRDGHGGRGVLVGRSASAGELRQARREIDRDPEGWIAQELIMLSTHPTVIKGQLQPRHVDLRPFVFYDGHTARTLPGGLTRVALREGSVIVNSSRQGGGKDTWVLA